MMRKLNFAFVGCGRIASKIHAPLVSSGLEEARLAAVCDIKADRAERMGEQYKVPWYTDCYAMMAAHPEVDVVSVLTESGNHGRNVVDLARYGKHIVVEKPIALRLADADKMIAACRAGGCRLFVVQQNRYNIPVQKLREAVRKKRFGTIFLLTVRVRWCRRQDYYDMDPWRGTWSLDGGVFSQQASHHLDAIEWIGGPVRSVFARAINAFARIEAEDTGTVSLTFKNGALGMIEATTAARPADMEGSLSVLGSRGTAEVGGFALNEMKTWRFEDQEPGDDEVLTACRTNPPTVYGFGHTRYLREVIDAIVHGKKALVEGPEGRKSLRLIHAVYRSIETGREVLLERKPVSARLGR
ncbi:MAG: Gfo/Idh/MocA family oxidoreductase [Candidatus Eremiobacteraeota bacterium]|nr:Gfo/Idh/MocA family oxidoreductase [Candidatus Eremiobacteraeota bacterium]